MLGGAIAGLISGAAGGALLMLVSESALSSAMALGVIFGAPIGLGVGALSAALAVGIVWLLGRPRVGWVPLFASAVVVFCLPQALYLALPGPGTLGWPDLLLTGIGVVLALPAALGVARFARPRARRRPAVAPTAQSR